ncbi:MAG: hypothetical protein HN985_08775 [Planctomycetaceae bacterium]|nr:hypothetical protein [Planctomycetaceae bacterium]MBT6919803.1 hypothetical protein [Planctomycetaceae bacterium]MBT7729660.1 hypothetical protein [Planctomycetaceae bacterium]
MPRLYFQSTIFCMVIGLYFMSTPVMSAERNEDQKWTPTKMFEKKDTNKDGFMTLEEFKQGGNEKFLKNADKRFSKLDTNHDEKVSPAELKAGWDDMTRNKKKSSSLEK